MLPPKVAAWATFWLTAGLSASWTSRVAGQACVGVQDALGLQSAASNLAGDAVVNICNDIALSATISIARPITLVGQCPSPGCRIYPAPSSSSTRFRLFDANANGTVTFRNLWLDKGDISNLATHAYGGAINARTSTYLVADTVLFTNNRESSGGAIYYLGNATINSCTFVNNSAIYSGGALYAEGTAMEVRNSNFTQNSAVYGGAIRVYSPYDSSGPFIVKNAIRGSLFLYNHASYGGAVYVSSGTNNVTIAGNTFANNTAYSNGGAVNDAGGYLTLLSGNSFIQNYAPDGGAVSLYDSYAIFASPNVFIRNSADSVPQGPGIRLSYGTTNFCPSEPVGIVTVLFGGVVNSGCAFANCGANNPCDPTATCTLSGGVPVCTCPAGVSGSGWLCENRDAGLLAVGASNNFTVPPFVNLTAGSGASPSQYAVTVSGPPPAGTTSPAAAVAAAEESSSTGLIAGLAGAGVGAVVLLGVIVGCLVYRKKKRAHHLPVVKGDVDDGGAKMSADKSAVDRTASTVSTAEADADEALGSSWRRFTYSELKEATGGFAPSALLGEGAYGKVYVATLANGSQVAVKQLKSGNQVPGRAGHARPRAHRNLGLGEREFLGELGTLGRVRHRNLVALRGYCITPDACFLVLDYAPNGNLDAALRSTSSPPLDWETRVNIAWGAARGLSYLHNDTEPSILHRDIKPANILLDAKMQAQVADFGLAKLLEEGDSHLSTHLRGTYGYVAPEYALNGQVTKRSDVYSFGVVLLEILTGYRALELTPEGNRKNLVDAVTRTAHKTPGRQQPLVIMDPRLEKQFSTSAALRMITLALACCASEDSRRPDMADVLYELESLSRGEPGPGFRIPQTEPADDGSGDWFGPVRTGSLGMQSGSTAQSSVPSHSTWSEMSGVSRSEGHQMSIAYQMSMLSQGR
ncbi:Protein kinase superfamily protein containing beta_helix [Klebsormidium nitens]|uniref:Protein kinase superfamily protein containing beta_helix n=1 Tax=Klebsormidium nitens TaxID=105231 RepID=A0A0U9I6M1_KLENI|nr:Protein kinase superfamily protein containing beta_helix [Klebsormidium nitens]|eukprot:GAQ80440.1 Protein kinase superfamily protein containing beta_helix [Klebsormidium nitens]